MSDIIDIYDANLRPLGSKDRKQAHYDGNWHRTFHCWVVDSTSTGPQVLFQKRSPTMKNFPGMLDVSAAGHLEAGESPEDGIREIVEELGIKVGKADVVYIGDRVEVSDQENGQQNREYQAVHLLLLREDQRNFHPDQHEIFGLYWIALRDGMELFGGRQSEVRITGIALDANGEYKPSSLLVGIKDFLPRIQRYYLTSLICIERLLEGKKDISIS